MNGRKVTKVEEGQPFSLDLIYDVATYLGDQDAKLIPILKSGVPTGYKEDIPPSGIFHLKKNHVPEDGPPPLQLCEGNWKRAEDNPDRVLALVKDDLDEGFIGVWDGSIDDAKKTYADRLAIGKLGITIVEGKSDRLTFDTTINNVNPGSVIPEGVQLPSPAALAHHCQVIGPTTTNEQTIFTVDVKKAHKRIRLKQTDWGLMFFQLLGVLYFYKVCPYGGTFSAYWWGRFGAIIIRISHRLVYVCLL